MRWKAGFEIELLAPRGRSRRDLAEALAGKAGGSVRRILYPQSEPSLLEDTPVFENLILGFDALDARGEPIARCVDDLTIRRDLDRNSPPIDGWYRILSDDIRLLRLAMKHCDPDADVTTVLEPMAALFDAELSIEGGDIVRLADRYSTPIALATGLPGERERPCEIVTPPYDSDHEAALERLLSVARELDFTVPAEAAVHVHFDATRLRDSAAVARLVETIGLHGKAFRRLMDANPNCLRMARNPKWLFRTVAERGFAETPWEEARERLRDRGLSKFVDFNFLNMVYDIPGKSTFELRILPGAISAAPILKRAEFFEALLNWCIEAPRTERPERKLARFIAQVDPPEKAFWLSQ